MDEPERHKFEQSMIICNRWPNLTRQLQELQSAKTSLGILLLCTKYLQDKGRYEKKVWCVPWQGSTSYVYTHHSTHNRTLHGHR